VVRDGTAEIAVGATILEEGDQILAILEPGKEIEVRKILLGR
jgi:Trk K+ transport system NAD-binding subunit